MDGTPDLHPVLLLWIGLVVACCGCDVGFLAGVQGDAVDFDPLVEGAGLQLPLANRILGRCNTEFSNVARTVAYGACTGGGDDFSSAINGDEASVQVSGNSSGIGNYDMGPAIDDKSVAEKERAVRARQRRRSDS